MLLGWSYVALVTILLLSITLSSLRKWLDGDIHTALAEIYGTDRKSWEGSYLLP